MTLALALTGPTASGKTALSLAIARELGCEIICCDSMQIYEEMSIGTAKATEKERAACPHHMLDFLSPLESYSAEDYRADAMRAVEQITDRGATPLFVGGTGLYLDTLMRGGALLSPPSSDDLKTRILSEVKTEEDKDRLYQRLCEIDPVAASKTHKNNVRRVARALEIYELTGKTKTYFDEQSRAAQPELILGHITLDFHNRENLYLRADTRVEQMMQQGLLDEVRSLYARGLLRPDTTAAQAIGYKELVTYLEGKTELADAVEQIKLSTRRYAKRQLTWFRHTSALRVYVDCEDGVMKDGAELIAEAVRIAREFIKENNG